MRVRQRSRWAIAQSGLTRRGSGSRCRRRNALNTQDMHLPAVGAQHLKFEAVNGDHFAALGHAREAVDHEAADGVGDIVRQGRAEMLVESRNFGERTHPMAALSLSANTKAAASGRGAFVKTAGWMPVCRT